MLHRNVTQAAANTIAVVTGYGSTSMTVPPRSASASEPTVNSTFFVKGRRTAVSGDKPSAAVRAVVYLMTDLTKVLPATLRLTVRLIQIVETSDGVMHAFPSSAEPPMDDIVPGVPVTFDACPRGEYFVEVSAQTGAAGATFTSWRVDVEEI